MNEFVYVLQAIELDNGAIILFDPAETEDSPIVTSRVL
jgi:hypothetical protein